MKNGGTVIKWGEKHYVIFIKNNKLIGWIGRDGIVEEKLDHEPTEEDIQKFGEKLGFCDAI